jgi:uncharacterized protein (DUF2147 family)
MSQPKTHIQRETHVASATRQTRHALRRWCACLALGLCGWLACASPAARADGDPRASPTAAPIVGYWLVESRDAVIRIEPVGDQYEGHIVWQLHDKYGPEDGAELSGKTVTDRKNPDPALRSRPLTGLRLLWGLRYDPDRATWVDGRVYNSDNGKVYHCEIRMLGEDKLRLRGYIGITLLGGNTIWTRVDGPGPKSSKSS